MSKLRRLIAHGIVEQDVTRRAGKPLLGTEHVGYLHSVVVDDVGQVVSRIAVRLQQYHVVQSGVLEYTISPDDIVEPGFPGEGRFEAHHRRDAFFLLLSPLLLAQLTTVAVIARRLLAPGLVSTHLLQALRAAVAVVSIALGHKSPGSLLVQLQTL